jgi:hypothetical protein
MQLLGTNDGFNLLTASVARLSAGNVSSAIFEGSMNRHTPSLSSGVLEIATFLLVSRMRTSSSTPAALYAEEWLPINTKD